MTQHISVQRLGDCIVLKVNPCISWDLFVPWAQNLVQRFATIVPDGVISGGDMHMIDFTFRQNRFSFHYENYSDSIWIEAAQTNAGNHLDALMSELVIDSKNKISET